MKEHSKKIYRAAVIVVVACTLPTAVEAQPLIAGQPEDVRIPAGNSAFVVTEVFTGNFNPAYFGEHPDKSNPAGFATDNSNGQAIWTSEPLFKSTKVWFELCNNAGCSVTRTVTITVVGGEPEGPPAAFEGAEDLGGDWWFSAWFGALNIEFQPWIFHAQHGWMFLFTESSPDSVFLYDLSSDAWVWTSTTQYPNQFSFARNAWVFYFKDTSGPREFVDLQSGEFFNLD